MTNAVISDLFTANLSFSALLLAVEGILISMYLRAEHPRWRRNLRILILTCGGTFLIGVFDSILSLLHILSFFQHVSDSAFNLIVALFLGELGLMLFLGLFLVLLLVVE